MKKNSSRKGGSQDNLLEHEVPMGTSEELDKIPVLDKLGAQTPGEKRFLLLVERGDVASVKRLLNQFKGQPEVLLIDCVDPLGRNALTIAIENENYDLIQLLLKEGVKVKDALLHAIKEEYVEAVEILLEWEESHHKPGTPYSWEAADRDTATFTPDITPLVLAAHKNNYEIIKILLDRGATIPVPHDVKCGCDSCVSAALEDSLRHSRSRINAYRALASPSLICLSSKDPFLTAFELSRELRRLTKAEAEFKAEYNDLCDTCQDFATMLLSHARTSVELQTLLNYQKGNEGSGSWEPGERQNLERLKMAIKYKQKKFVAHPSVQQLLASMWYDGLPGFRRKTLFAQLIDVATLGLNFPLYSLHYMIAPDSTKGKFIKKPFVKFICHSASYIFFLTLLAAASQRFEFVVLEAIGNEWSRKVASEWRRKERGALPGVVESIIVVYILGWIWAEIKALWSDGLLEYISDLWNVVDFITNSFYVVWLCLRATAFYCVTREAGEGRDPYYPRESWDMLDPMLISEGAFGAAMIFSFLKLVHIFSINPHLGPLQISLGRMIVDIMKFFFIYSLVLFAFGCGLNQLLWYYAALEKEKCFSMPHNKSDFDVGDSCFIWRRFANLFETSQSLFWASFGLIELDAFELTGIKGFTRFWGLLMFGSYSVINIIVLLNMLIAMMSNSYQIISERSDTEWKFARSKLWISYFDEGGTVPPPFNIIPTFKSLKRILCCGKKIKRVPTLKVKRALNRYMNITRLLVRRFVSTEEYKKQERAGISEDDVNEIRQDISSFRYELIDVLRTNGMRTPNLQPDGALVPGRKGKVMERRLLKDFQIGVIENAIKEAIQKSDGESKDVFSRIAKIIWARRDKKDWNAFVRNTSVKADPIGTKQASLKREGSISTVRRSQMETDNEALFSMDPHRLVEYNPKLRDVSAATRVAYAKFKTKMMVSQAFLEEAKPPPMGLRRSLSLTEGSLLSQPSTVLTQISDQIESPFPGNLDAKGNNASETPILRPINNELSRTIQTCSVDAKPPIIDPEHFETGKNDEGTGDDVDETTPIPIHPSICFLNSANFTDMNSSKKDNGSPAPHTIIEVGSSESPGKEEPEKPISISTSTFPSGRSAITGVMRTGWI